MVKIDGIGEVIKHVNVVKVIDVKNCIFSIIYDILEIIEQKIVDMTLKSEVKEVIVYERIIEIHNVL